jgi:hypothetical protein
MSPNPDSNHANPANHCLWQKASRPIRSTTPPTSPAMPVPNELISLSPCHSGNSKTMLVAPEGATPTLLRIALWNPLNRSAGKFYSFSQDDETVSGQDIINAPSRV